MELWFLFSAHRLLKLYICTRFCENISMCLDTISIVKFKKGHNSVKNVGGDMVLALCMSFDDVLYLFKVS